jgi:hypothetical protein
LLRGECQYNNVILKLKVESEIIGVVSAFVTVDKCSLKVDSLNSDDYLIGLIESGTKKDSVAFHCGKMSFKYCTNGKKNCTETLKNKVYKLIYPWSIPKSFINKITFVQKQNTPSFIKIINDLSIKDTSWIYRQPTYTYFTEGYLCNYKIFVFSAPSEAYKIINQIKRLNAKIDSLITVKKLSTTSGELYDSQMQNLVYKLLEYPKIAIIQECLD